MATSKKYTVKFRRYRSGRTDYKSRLRLLVSRKLRLVIRKTLNNIYLQVVSYQKEGDKIILSVNPKDLKKYGWNYNLSNLPSCYLIGLLLGVKIKKQDIKEIILDIGLRSSIPGSKIYSALKGVLDSGVTIPHDEKIIPREDRIKGKHIMDYALSIKKDPEIYKKQFSAYLKNNANPEDIVKNFDQVKKKILQG